MNMAYRLSVVVMVMGALIAVQAMDGAAVPRLSEEVIEAARRGDVGFVRNALDNGLNIEAVNNQGRTLLCLAAVKGHPQECSDMVAMLLEKGAQVNARGSDWSTALHLFARMGNVDVVSKLIGYRAAIDAKNRKGRTPLFEAVSSNCTEAVGVLLQGNANPNGRDKQGASCLMYAADENNVALVNALIESRADVRVQTYVTKETALIHAFSCIQREDGSSVVKALLDNGALVAPADFVMDSGEARIAVAMQQEHNEVVKWLVKNKAPIDAVDVHNATAFHYALIKGNSAMTRLLLENGALAHVWRIADGTSSVRKAFDKGFIDIVKMLLFFGGDFKALSDGFDGHTSVIKLDERQEAKMREGIEMALTLRKALGVHNELLSVLHEGVDDYAAHYTGDLLLDSLMQDHIQRVQLLQVLQAQGCVVLSEVPLSDPGAVLRLFLTHSLALPRQQERVSSAQEDEEEKEHAAAATGESAAR